MKENKTKSVPNKDFGLVSIMSVLTGDINDS